MASPQVNGNLPNATHSSSFIQVSHSSDKIEKSNCATALLVTTATTTISLYLVCPASLTSLLFSPGYSTC